MKSDIDRLRDLAEYWQDLGMDKSYTHGEHLVFSKCGMQLKALCREIEKERDLACADLDKFHEEFDALVDGIMDGLRDSLRLDGLSEDEIKQYRLDVSRYDKRITDSTIDEFIERGGSEQ